MMTEKKLQWPPVYLVSACLVGLPTRYDGASRPSAECRRHLAGAIWVPVCPEQLGGLADPAAAGRPGRWRRGGGAGRPGPGGYQGGA